MGLPYFTVENSGTCAHVQKSPFESVCQLTDSRNPFEEMAKRKRDQEYRYFKQEWTEEFAFMERAGSAVCMICDDKIVSMKRSNMKRHFDTRHSSFASKYPAWDSRKKAWLELFSRVQTSQQQLRVWAQQGSCNSASFAGTLAIV